MIKDPYIGMPVFVVGSHENHRCCCDFDGEPGGSRPGGAFDNMHLGDLPLAMCYVPMQQWNETYSLEKGLERGTIFPELDLPFMGAGKRGGKRR